jgi:hypothetical protein
MLQFFNRWSVYISQFNWLSLSCPSAPPLPLFVLLRSQRNFILPILTHKHKGYGGQESSIGTMFLFLSSLHQHSGTTRFTNRHSLPLFVSHRLQINWALFILHPSRMCPISSLEGVSPANLLLFLWPRSIGMYLPSRKFQVFKPTSHFSVRLWRPFCYVLESISSTDDPFNIVCLRSFWFIFGAFDAIALHVVVYVSALIGGSRCLC